MAPLAKMVGRAEMGAVVGREQRPRLLSGFACLRWGRPRQPVQARVEQAVIVRWEMQGETAETALSWVTERAADRAKDRAVEGGVRQVLSVPWGLSGEGTVPVRKYPCRGCLQPVVGMALMEWMAEMVEMERMVQLVSWWKAFGVQAVGVSGGKMVLMAVGVAAVVGAAGG